MPVEVSVHDGTPSGSWAGRWRRVGLVDAGPPRVGAVVLEEWGRVVVWGGVGGDGVPLNDGFEVLPSGRTRSIPPAPLSPRTDFAWSGDRAGNLLIWGGIDAQGTRLTDGAWYSMGGRRWTVIPPGPLPAGPAAMAGDLNDLYVVVEDPVTGLPVMAVLHRHVTESGSWGSAIPVVRSVPLPAGERYEVISCCTTSTGEGWVIVLSVQADGFAHAARYGFEPGPQRWEQLGRVPVGPGRGGGPVQGFTTEHELTAWVRTASTPYAGTDLTGPLAAIARTEAPRVAWRLGAAPSGALGDPSLVLAPSHLVSVNGMVAWDLVADEWLDLPGGRRGVGMTGSTAWWLDDRLWVYGGRRPDGTLDRDLWTFTPTPARGTFDLPGEGRESGEACYVYARMGRGPWRLRGDPDDPMLVWAQHGPRRVALGWPDGWVVRFRRGLEIVRPDGVVVARGGHRCRIDAGSGG